MKGLCLLLVFVSFGSYAQVRENIKVKHQSQTRAKYVPESFVTEKSAVTVKEASPKEQAKGKKQVNKGKR